MFEEDKRGILLESGTNEIEVMEFTIDGEWNGLTIKKVLLDRLRFSRAAVTALKRTSSGSVGCWKVSRIPMRKNSSSP